MTVRRFAVADLPASAWKNGGGSTRELLSLPVGSDQNTFGWRVSVATIAADGAFSTFPDVDRTITLIGGDGIHLRGPGIDHRLDTLHVPFDFDGGIALDCALLGQRRSIALNVMARRGHGHAKVSIVSQDTTASATHGVLVSLVGDCQVGSDLITEGTGLWWAGSEHVGGFAPARQPGRCHQLGTDMITSRKEHALMTRVHRDDLAELCSSALRRAGADPRAAQILAEATVEAELVGNRATGVAHLFDYLDGYRDGRIATHAEPVLRHAAKAVIEVDAGSGLAQTAFADAVDDFQGAIREAGLAALWIRSSFTCGELGYYARRLAQQGFMAVAVANSPALMSVGGAPRSVLGTNPLAYAIPRLGMLPVVIDQASSSTAFVNIRRAAEAGEPIPAGWALDADGAPTQDAGAALEGTLLPFGSHRGGNIALLVEVLATLSGASFSLDAAPFDRGNSSPGIGVFVLGIDPAVFAGSVDRLSRHFETLRCDHGVRLPAFELTALPDAVEVNPDILQRLNEAAEAA